jgi:adenosylcobinamide-phosphate synthase
MVNGIPVDLAVLALALVLDLVCGELPNRFHPTVWMGKTIGWAEKAAPKSHGGQLAYGGAVALLIPALWGLAAYGAVQGLNAVHPLAYIAGGALLLKTTFAVRMLHRAAAGIRSSLLKHDIAAVRAGMPALVSRDPSSLTAEEATAAAVESVSENLTDSLVGPLLAFALFGLPGAAAYRAVNTLDSMIGYHGRYEYLGKASARLDDLVNLVPARLTALFLVVASLMVPGQAAVSAWRIMWRDHSRTESPNAGWTMSGMAGALGVALEKTGHYRLGDATRPVEPQDISRAVQTMYWVTAQAGIIAAGIMVLMAWLNL